MRPSVAVRWSSPEAHRLSAHAVTSESSTVSTEIARKGASTGPTARIASRFR